LRERIARDGKIELHPDGWSARSDLETMPDRHRTVFKRFLSRFFPDQIAKLIPPRERKRFDTIPPLADPPQQRRVTVFQDEMLEQFRAGKPYVWVNADGSEVVMGKQPDPTWRRV
jgi:hypothetical protein